MFERELSVDGYKTRLIEQGSGPLIVLMHGSSLGSSADDWREALPAFAGHGFRAVSYDQLGFGTSEAPRDFSMAYRQRFILSFLDELGAERATLVGHSQAGRLALSTALDIPERVTAAVVVCTRSLLPPLDGGQPDADAFDREPSVDDTRKDLESLVYDRASLTPERIARFHRFSTGLNFKHATMRTTVARPAHASGTPARPDWQRLAEPAAPLMLIYGADDRGPIDERVGLARTRYEHLRIELLERCGHFAQWDRPDAVVRLIAEFLT